jgi:hypothetical protein
MAMPKLNLEQFLSGEKYDRGLMIEIARLVEDAINRISEGRIYQSYNASATAPTGTTVAYQIGDIVRNVTPTEQGSVASKYIVWGFICVAAGNPGTWREMRVLTGN